jgi:hypothetical protein
MPDEYLSSINEHTQVKKTTFRKRLLFFIIIIGSLLLLGLIFYIYVDSWQQEQGLPEFLNNPESSEDYSEYIQQLAELKTFERVVEEGPNLYVMLQSDELVIKSFRGEVLEYDKESGVFLVEKDGQSAEFSITSDVVVYLLKRSDSGQVVVLSSLDTIEVGMFITYNFYDEEYKHIVIYEVYN